MTHGIEWLAGLYEGEGTVGVYGSGKSKQVRFAIVSTNRDVLETAREASGGLDGIYRARPANERHKACYSWGVSRREDIIQIGELILPYLHERRRVQLQEVIDWCREALVRRVRTGDGWRTNGRAGHVRAA